MASPIWTAAGEEDFCDYDGFVLGDDLPECPSDVSKWTSSEVGEDTAKNSSSSNQSDVTRAKGGFGVPKKKTTNNRHGKTGSREGTKRLTKHAGRDTASRMIRSSVDDLRVAAMKGNVEGVKKCLQEGFQVDAALKCGWTPLMYAASWANQDIVQLLLQAGAKPNFHYDQFTVLMACCASTKQDEDSVLRCSELLVEAGADINAHDRYHLTPLIYAARAGHELIVNYFGEKGVQLDKQDGRGWTALSWAVSKNMKITVQKLLELKADPYKKHCDGQTAADLAFAENFQELLVLMKDPRAQPQDNSSLPTGVVPGHLSKERNYGLTSSYIKHGELELFLRGLSLTSLVDLFQHHHIDFAALLRLTEPDLEKIGIEQVGVRKKILDGIQKVHHKDWESSSLPAVQSTKVVSYSQSVALMSNISSHLLYISSSVAYIRNQLTAHPDILDVQDGNGPKVLCQQTIDSMVNLQNLTKEIESLQTFLGKVVTKGNFQPADLVKKPNSRHRKGRLWRRKLVKVGAVVVTFSVVVYWRETVAQTITNAVIKAKSLV